MKPMSVSPTICPECGHRFPPGAPDPSCCPDCRRVCSGYGESEEIKLPIPEEMPVTSEERARWKRGFWVFLFIGPVLALVFMFFRQDIVSSVPPSLRGFVQISSQPILSLGLSAAGAGLCLANARFARRRLADKLAYSFLFGIDVLAAYAGIILVGGVMRFLMFP